MKNTTIAMIALLSAAVLSGAQEALSVEQAVRTALAGNAGLIRSRIDLEAAGRAVDVSWNGLVPSLSAGAGASRPNGSESAMYGLAQASLMLSPSLLSAGSALVRDGAARIRDRGTEPGAVGPQGISFARPVAQEHDADRAEHRERPEKL